MGTSNDSDEFKRDAVRQIRGRGYPVREVSLRLGVSSRSLYKWMKLLAEPAPKASGADHEAENRRLKRALARVTDERDILKKINGGLRARVPMTGAIGAPLVRARWRRPSSGRIRPSSASGPCAGCCRFTSAAFTRG